MVKLHSLAKNLRGFRPKVFVLIVEGTCKIKQWIVRDLVGGTCFIGCFISYKQLIILHELEHYTVSFLIDAVSSAPPGMSSVLSLLAACEENKG